MTARLGQNSPNSGVVDTGIIPIGAASTLVVPMTSHMRRPGDAIVIVRGKMCTNIPKRSFSETFLLANALEIERAEAVGPLYSCTNRANSVRY
jgi:hypothetical protein